MDTITFPTAKSIAQKSVVSTHLINAIVDVVDFDPQANLNISALEHNPGNEFTFHFQRASAHGLTMQETIRSATSSNGVVVLRGDATGHNAEIQLLREAGIQFRDETV